MNILHISPYLPSLKANHAGGICMGKEIETLREKNQVYVLTFIASEFDRRLAEELKADERYHFVRLNPVSKFLHILLEPWLPNYFAARSSFRFAWRLIWCVRHYRIEAIHGEYASMAQYQWICRLFPYLRYNMTEHDVTVQAYERKLEASKGLRRLYFRYQLARVRACERRYCRRADCVLTLNEKDQKLLQREYGLSEVVVLNPYFGIEDSDIRPEGKKKNAAEANSICFLGQMGREENEIAAMRLIEVGKHLRENGIRNQIYIVGNHPSDALCKLANDHVHVTGFVDEVDPYLERAVVGAFPLTLGAGIKLKVLRSMALGTPVVTSAIGAEGIDEEGQVLELAETEEEFAKKIQQIFSLPEKEYEELSRRNTAYVRRYFSWGRSAGVLHELYAGRR